MYKFLCSTSIKCLVFCWALITSPYLFANSKIQFNIPNARSNVDISHDYHLQLLQRLLAQINQDEHVTINVIESMTQGRAEAELVHNKLINLYWLGASTDIDNTLHAIEVPTTKGLIGIRKFFVHHTQQEKLDRIKTVKDLSRFVACQGEHWPDTKILRYAGLPVTTSPQYEYLFGMLNKNRCDYFPRGVHDFLTEMPLRNNWLENVKQLDSIILHYPFAVYFYTHNDNKDIIAIIEKGMHKLAENGGIEQLMRQHPLTKEVFVHPAAKGQHLIQIANPYIKKTPLMNDERYWFKPTQFLIN